MKTVLVDAYGTFVLEGVGMYKEMFDLLETYPNKKLVLTNANDEQMVAFGLTDLPYEVFTLKHNPDKDDNKYFIEMLKNFNLAAEDVVYFEHSPEAVKSAQSVGINSFYYDSEKKDLVALKEFLDKNC